MRKLNKAQKAALQVTIDAIDAAKGDVESLLQDIQTAYDDKSEKWQQGDAGNSLQEQIDNLGEAMDDLDGAMDKLNGIRDWES